MNRRAMLAKVHLAKKELCLDDEVYRSVLERVTGHRSAASLSDRQLDQALREFRRLGWTPAEAQPRQRSQHPEVRKIWALWGDMCRSGCVREPTPAALRSFVERMTHVADPEWLTVEQARLVIEALKAWSRRAGKGTTHAG